AGAARRVRRSAAADVAFASEGHRDTRAPELAVVPVRIPVAAAHGIRIVPAAPPALRPRDAHARRAGRIAARVDHLAEHATGTAMRARAVALKARIAAARLRFARTIVHEELVRPALPAQVIEHAVDAREPLVLARPEGPHRRSRTWAAR